MKPQLYPGLLLLLCSSYTLAEENAGMTSSMAMKDILTYAKAQKDYIIIRSKNGQEYSTRRIGDIGDKVVILNGYRDYEYYDVYLPYTEISTIEVRTRGK